MTKSLEMTTVHSDCDVVTQARVDAVKDQEHKQEIVEIVK